VHGLPPVIVLKKGQVLMELSTKDFSFVEEKPMGQFHRMLGETRTRPNLTQNGAVSLLCVLDDNPEKIEKLALAASAIFDVQLEKNLTLLTVRHYDEATVEELTRGRTRVLEQKTTQTIQVLLR
jgi:aspartate kinase